MSRNDAGDRELAAQAAATLRRPRGLPVVITALMLFAASGLWSAGSQGAALPFFALSLLAGALAAYAVARARYDAIMFRAWATVDDLPAAVARFDTRWSRGRPAVARPMAERVAGAMHWRQRAILATLAQGTLTAAGLWPLHHLMD